MAPDPAPPSDPAASDAPPQGDLPESFGRFRIIRLLGQGGMGIVYLAEDPKKGRQIALKVLAREKADNQTLLKRFRSEALATRELKHENIVGVYEAGSIAGQFYIALEFVAGTDVARLIQSRGRLPVRRSLDITYQVALALSVAHQRSIVHRDIKPSNLLIRRDGVVKLTDMGLARSLDGSGEAGITRAGTTVGTVDYISPEQARDSKAADVRSDIYSLGCTWYHMLTGQAPFPDGSLAHKLQSHAITPAPDPRQFNDTIPEGVVAVLERMLEKSPERRYQHPDELAEALSAIDLDRTELSANIIAALADDDPGCEPSRDPGPHKTRRPHPDAPTSSTATSDTNVREEPLTSETLDAVPLVKTDVGDTGDRAADLVPPRRRQRRDRVPNQPPTDSSGSTPDSTPRRTSSADQQDSHSSTSGDKPASTRTTPPPSPRSRRAARRLEPEDAGDERGLDWERLKPIGLMVLGASLLGLLGYVFVNLSQSVDMSGTQEGGSPFGSRDGGPGNGRGVPATSAGDDTIPGGTPGAAPVFETLPAPVLVGRPATPPPTPKAFRPGELPYLFDWVRRPPVEELPVLIVAGREFGPGHFHSLDAALSAVTEQGGWIQLRGPGPFFITAIELVDRGRVVISAAKAARAIVVLRPDPLADTHPAILNLKNTALDLRRVDLSPSENAFPGDRRLTLISCQSSDLRLADCSITQPQHREGGTAAVAVSGPAGDRASRILFERVLARGRNSTMLELDSRSADVALLDSLLLTDSASPITVHTPGGTTNSDDRRRIRLLSCTLCSDAALLQLDSGSSVSTLPTTQLTVVNSLLACTSSGDRVLLDLGRWPQQGNTPSPHGRFQRLDWEQHASVSYGVREYIRRDTEVGLGISSFSGWRACWKTPGEETHFVAQAWQPLSIEADRVRPADFDTGRLDRLPSGTDGNPPGCRVLGLHEPDSHILARAPGQTGRPTWFPQQPSPRPLLSLQLSDHPDLGRFLAEHPPPPGAVIVVEGSGRRATSPIVVAGGSLKLVFRDAKHGPPLVLVPNPPGPARPPAGPLAEPRPADPPPLTTAEFSGTAPTALFHVNGGTLELVGGRFQLPDSAGPAWLLQVTAGHFSIHDCSLLGPRGPTRTDRGLIKWSGTEPGGSGRIHRSYLAGSGALLKADFRGRSLLVHQSLLFSTGSAFDLDLGRGDTPVRSALDIRHCSLSAAGPVFLVRSQPGGTPATPATDDVAALDLFVDQTVVAPGFAPTAGGKAQPVLISCPSRLLEDRMVRWWGTSNGFTPELTTYLAERNGDGPTGEIRTARDFATLFPSPHRARPLHGPRGVTLAGQLPGAAGLRPRHFRLDRASRGHSWGPGGRVIGADLDRLDSQLGDVGPSPTGTSGDLPDF